MLKIVFAVVAAPFALVGAAALLCALMRPAKRKRRSGQIFCRGCR